jgi:hypothetical protein
LRQPGEPNTVSSGRVTEQDLSESEPVPIKPAVVTVSEAPAPVEAPRRDDTATIAIIRNLRREEYKVLKFNRWVPGLSRDAAIDRISGEISSDSEERDQTCLEDFDPLTGQAPPGGRPRTMPRGSLPTLISHLSQA